MAKRKQTTQASTLPSMYLVIARAGMDDLPMLLTPSAVVAKTYAQKANLGNDLRAAANFMKVDTSIWLGIAILRFHEGRPISLKRIRDVSDEEAALANRPLTNRTPPMAKVPDEVEVIVAGRVRQAKKNKEMPVSNMTKMSVRELLEEWENNPNFDARERITCQLERRCVVPDAAKPANAPAGYSKTEEQMWVSGWNACLAKIKEMSDARQA